MRTAPAATATATATASSMLCVGAGCHRGRDDKRDRPDPKG
jgi:hypothetical protein